MLKRVKIQFKNEAEWLKLRSQDITSTEISALFNSNPWLTEFELWHTKKAGDIGGIEKNEAMEIGIDFEAPIAKFIAKKEGWKIRPKKHYVRLDGLRIGSSFDYEIFQPFEAVFEIKNVSEMSYKNQWKENGDNIEAPVHLEFQFQHELLVSGAEKLVVGVMVGGNRRKYFTRLPDPKVHEAILAKCAAFWKSTKENKEPAPNLERDAAYIAKLFNKAEKGKEIESTVDINTLAVEYREYSKAEEEYKKKKEVAKAQLLMKIGNASRVNGEDFFITCGPTSGSTYTVERKPGRSFRVYFNQGEENAKPEVE